jgi:hypothetical protein
MSHDPAARKWQRAIVATCESILGRALAANEAEFIRSRAGYMALEAIQDHVGSLEGKPEELAAYLNSENPPFAGAAESGVR